MTRIKTILFVCGTGVATSTAVNVAATEAMKQRGLTFHARQAKATEVPSLADDVDFIVTTTPISGSVTKPVIKGLAFLTGMGKDKVLDEIEAELRKYKREGAALAMICIRVLRTPIATFLERISLRAAGIFDARKYLMTIHSRRHRCQMTMHSNPSGSAAAPAAGAAPW